MTTLIVLALLALAEAVEHRTHLFSNYVIPPRPRAAGRNGKRHSCPLRFISQSRDNPCSRKQT
jgi:hypothetical protein